MRIIDLWTGIATLPLVAAAALACGVVGEDPSAVWRNGRLIGLIGNANVMAAVCGCILLLALARALSLTRRGSHPIAPRSRTRSGERALVPVNAPSGRRGPIAALHIAVAIGAVVALLMTGSRFPFALAVILAVGLAIRGLVRGRLQRKALFAAAAIGVAGMIAASSFGGVLFERFDDLASDSTPRAAMWARYLDAVQHSPWFGYGPGGFASLNSATLADPFAAQSMWTLNSPHNVLLQVMLTGGIPYLLLALAASAVVLTPILQYFRSARRSIEAAGLAAVAIFVFGCAMVDIVLDTPVGTMTALFFVGLLWGEALAVT